MYLTNVLITKKTLLLFEKILIALNLGYHLKSPNGYYNLLDIMYKMDIYKRLLQ